MTRLFPGARLTLTDEQAPSPLERRSANATQITCLANTLANALPIIGGTLRRGAARALAAEGGPISTRILAEAVTCSRDPDVREIARAHLAALREPQCIDAACAVWGDSRHPVLTELMVEGQWLPSGPAGLRILAALQVERSDAIASMRAAAVAPLLAAARDPDRTIAERAAAVLHGLVDPAMKDALCQLAVEQGDARAREIVLAAGYLPRDEEARALFLFLTEQWAGYETLDFDHRLLRSAYEAAPPALRRRILDRVRASGRTDFLTVIAGVDDRARIDTLDDAEVELLVRMLADHQEWERLWSLAFEVCPRWSARIVALLVDAGWQPPSSDTRAVLAELAPLSARGVAQFVFSDSELRAAIPPAVLRARCHVPGRANDLAFAPGAPVVAIGTAHRRIGLWDFQQGKMVRVCRGFRHSVAKVAYLPDGSAVGAERSNTSSAPCGVYRCADDGLRRLGQHAGSVTALAALDEAHVLSAGRDGHTCVWRVDGDREPAARYHDRRWPRAACVSRDRTHVALMHVGITLATLPDLTPVAQQYDAGHVLRSATFAPDGDLVVGDFGGTVIVWRRNGSWLRATRLTRPGRAFYTRWGQRPARDPHPVATVGFVPARDVLLLGRKDGVIQFIKWSDRSVIGQVRVPGERVLSLRVSPDGAFLAAGDSEASLSLWDLRTLDAHRVLTAPFARAVPADVAVAAVMAASDNLPQRTRAAFRFIAAALAHRFRFDIEIADAPGIRYGEFDIEIE